MPMEPAPHRAETADFSSFPSVMEAVQRLAPPGGLAALLLSGSHASGEAVWATFEGRRVSLSDLDLYLVLGSDAARDRTMARARVARAAIDSAARAEGLRGPVEIAFLTAALLGRLPARPGTLELRRHARVVAGDAEVLALIPDWQPRDVSREERLLLLENRAFELLLAHPAVGAGGPLARLEARHALHKTALDLAAVAALGHGELPDGARARVDWARRHAPQPPPAWDGEGPAFGPALERVWDEAVVWRESGPRLPLENVEGAWLAVAGAWCALWLSAGEPAAGRGSAGPGPPDPNPYRRARRAARRAPGRRRLRLALFPETRAAGGPGLAFRARHALAGTPQHRVNAAAAVLLLAATRPGAEESMPTLDDEAVRTLRGLGLPPRGGWAGTARAVTRAWDVWVLEGRRVPAW